MTRSRSSFRRPTPLLRLFHCQRATTSTTPRPISFLFTQLTFYTNNTITPERQRLYKFVQLKPKPFHLSFLRSLLPLHIYFVEHPNLRISRILAPSNPKHKNIASCELSNPLDKYKTRLGRLGRRIDLRGTAYKQLFSHVWHSVSAYEHDKVEIF